MAKQLFIERRSHRRVEEVQTECSAAEQKKVEQRNQERAEEVADLEQKSDELLDEIDQVLALGIGHVSVNAA